MRRENSAFFRFLFTPVRTYQHPCKTYPVINEALENWPAVAPCNTLQLVNMKLFRLKVYEMCLNCWNTVLHQGIRTFEFVESAIICNECMFSTGPFVHGLR